MSIVKRIAGLAAVVALASVAAVSAPAPAEAASIPRGTAYTVFCPYGGGSCTEYRRSVVVPRAGGHLEIRYTVKWSSTRRSFEVVRVVLVNNTYATVFADSIGFVYAGHYYLLSLGYARSVRSGNVLVLNDAPGPFSAFNGNGRGKWLPRGKGVYASSDPSSPWYWYSTLAGDGTPGRFLLG